MEYIMIRLLGVKPSTKPGKKFMAMFSDGSIVHFGGRGCKDFIIYTKEIGRAGAMKKRAAYIRRHRVNESWLDPKAPGTLSRILLWHYPTLEQGIAAYDRLVHTWQRAPHLRYI